MKTFRTESQRVLAIDPSTQGFGYIVLESQTMPVDWGTKVIRRGNKEENLAKVSDLIQHYEPKILLIEEPKGSRRCTRIQALLEEICSLPKPKGLKVRRIPVTKVKKVFRAFGATTKYEIAHAIARQLPELTSRLPRFRKPWMAEDNRMSIFDSAALALTYSHSRSVRIREVVEPVPVEDTTILSSAP